MPMECQWSTNWVDGVSIQRRVRISIEGIEQGYQLKLSIEGTYQLLTVDAFFITHHS